MASIGLFLAGVFILVLFLPISSEERGQLLSFLSVVLSAMLALSSTSILGNALAGLMLRAQHSFRPGDFLQVEEHFGRVTERGLFHTEIQNEGRDLTTLPNLYLTKLPLTVLRSSGTLVSATVSLGYDVPRKQAEQALLQGALDAGLEEPFARILELGDFSIVYRVSGLLDQVKRIVSARARLNAKVLDALHHANIEIVSPSFMNQRVLALDQQFIPQRAPDDEVEDPADEVPEILMFDKAEIAGSLEQLRDLLEQTNEEVDELRRTTRQNGDDDEQQPARERLAQQEERAAWLMRYIEKREAESED